MGAIAGAVGFIGGEIEDGVRTMLSALGHRGRGAGEVYALRANGDSKGAILGVTYSRYEDPRDISRDLAVDPRNGTTLVCDGSIYNSHELRCALERNGESFRSSSDIEVVVKAHAAWDQGFLARLEGMFALAAWDPRSRVVSLARDRFGLKPLYWGEHARNSGARTILFASEVRALLQTGLFARRIDPVSLEVYAWNGSVMSPRSIVEGIHAIQPGKCLMVSADTGEVQERRYWFLGDYQGGDGGAKEIGDALRRAVERQQRSDVPVGFFLSGGMAPIKFRAAFQR